MHGYIAYCMKHGHVWHKERAGIYKCDICGARITRFCDGLFCEGCEE